MPTIKQSSMWSIESASLVCGPALDHCRPVDIGFPAMPDLSTFLQFLHTLLPLTNPTHDPGPYHRELCPSEQHTGMFFGRCRGKFACHGSNSPHSPPRALGISIRSLMSPIQKESKSQYGQSQILVVTSRVSLLQRPLHTSRSLVLAA